MSVSRCWRQRWCKQRNSSAMHTLFYIQLCTKWSMMNHTALIRREKMRLHSRNSGEDVICIVSRHILFCGWKRCSRMAITRLLLLWSSFFPREIHFIIEIEVDGFSSIHLPSYISYYAAVYLISRVISVCTLKENYVLDSGRLNINFPVLCMEQSLMYWMWYSKNFYHHKCLPSANWLHFETSSVGPKWWKPEGARCTLGWSKASDFSSWTVSFIRADD